MARFGFSDLRAEYAQLLANAVILPQWEKEAQRVAQYIIDARPTLQEVENRTGVPWWVVGVIQAMEAGCNSHGLRLDCHMHNGDSLQHQTHNVPAGRPPNRYGPFTFVESAVDAIQYDGLNKVDWAEGGVEQLLFRLEGYNGWGYRRYHAGVPSPYLWSGTNQYKRGKYVSDGQWSSTAVSGQIGAAPIIVKLKEMGVAEEKPQAISAADPPGASEGAVAGASAATVEAPRWPSAEQEKGTASQGEIAAEGSRSMGWIQWLKWKLGIGGGGFGLYEATYFLKGQGGTLHDINKFLSDNAALFIGFFLVACLVSACAAGFFLAEAHRDGRYDPHKPKTV